MDQFSNRELDLQIEFFNTHSLVEKTLNVNLDATEGNDVEGVVFESTEIKMTSELPVDTCQHV